MSLNAEESRFLALDNWFNSPQGVDVGEAFAFELSHLKELLYGETLVQLGNCGKNPWLHFLHYSHQWRLTPYANASSDLLSSFNYLPLDKHSVDCVIAPLTMLAFNTTKNPIDEIDRILKPMGYVVFFGINPLSLWGLVVRLRHFSCFGPLAGHPFSVLYIKRAMLHRGYLQCNLSSFYYIPPVSTKKWLNRLEIFNELGKMISPCPAGFYCLIMQKNEECHTGLLLDKAKEALWAKKDLLQPSYRLKPNKRNKLGNSI